MTRTPHPRSPLTAPLDRARALIAAARPRDAADLLLPLLHRHAADPSLLAMLAEAHLRLREHDRAAWFADRALAAAPASPPLLLLRAHVAALAEAPEHALPRFEAAVAAAPRDPDALAGRARTLTKLGDSAAALADLRRAAHLAPARTDLAIALARHLLEDGHADDACDTLRQAIARAPDNPDLRSALGVALNYTPSAPAQEALDHHRAYARLLEASIPPAATFPNTPDPDRPLRLGFVSRDLRQHSVAYFLGPLLEHLDRSRATATCYAVARADDATTQRLRDHADAWRPAADLRSPALAAAVRDDAIDVLIDLSGHTEGHRLPLFAARPAPVAVTWLGYPNTTGLTRITARFVDSTTDPAPDADALATEHLARLDPCFVCYRPDPDAPEPREHTGNAAFTFGSFNAVKKYSPATLDAWAAILAAAPGARLLLKHPRFRMPQVRQRLTAEFARRGADPARIDLLPADEHPRDHLARYHAVDLALDPFPYNGTTTTCDALWMGVPVLTLAGDRHAARVGASLLAAATLPDLVAPDTGAYVRAAAALAADPDRLAALRQGLRARVAASPLCHGPAFAARFEAACRSLWRRWCADPR